MTEPIARVAAKAALQAAVERFRAAQTPGLRDQILRCPASG